VDAVWKDSRVWTRKAILNVARAGRFSSDRTIQEYASEIWHVKPCMVAEPRMVDGQGVAAGAGELDLQMLDGVLQSTTPRRWSLPSRA
jgi:hypothetical protein